MNATGVAAFDTTLQTTHVWLNEICEELGWERDAHRAYHALRAVLHAIRDRLRPEAVAGLAAQLPFLIKGVFYEGWHPAGKPVKARTTEEFLAPVADAFRDDGWTRPDNVTRAVLTVLKRHVSAGEIADIIATLPADVQTLWG